MKLFKVFSLTIVSLILGIIIAWQFTSVKQNQVLAQYEKKNISEIVQELLQEKSNNESLKERIQELQAEAEAFRNDDNVDKKYVEDLERARILARMLAGLETVKGTGIIITLDSAGEWSIEARNIQDLTNELKASDAEAISVNDERIVATSEIRDVGSYIMINGRQLLPPYTIKAIGKPAQLQGALELMGGVFATFDVYDFAYKISQEENVVIPAVRDDGTVLRNSYMTPVD